MDKDDHCTARRKRGGITVKRILIIEDELDIAELEKDYLEINGYTVDIIQNGAEGFKRALSNQYHLIILDIMLPEMDGYKICREIRGIVDIPIIIVSAKKDEIDKIRGLGIGADDYITKPFSPQELVARIKSHLSRYERLKNNSSISVKELHFNTLRIEPETRRVYLAEREIILTTKEFDLLLFLASNPDIVFNKDALFEKIWGLDSLGDVATVTVHIRKLREKIEQDPSDPKYIETIWGAGYRFKKSL
ncbi:response regulator transcription factor [Fusibacter paucivorans]|uniref:Stage 0 sporulation protein A homolog n=1 Tax=Fusibacter paucivorans TaxID=76009 RepID=A0ABS5PSZ9_9FIRM|nr:response regulator transcription factor [Fusibacter paucivorans]